ncbi:MAG: phospholipase D-like domain-containing protein [Planctomycetota bacterium]
MSADRDLPLQHNLTPWSPTLRRLALVLSLALLVMIVGWLAPRRTTQPVLVLSGKGHEGEYPRTAEKLISSARTRLWMAMYVIHLEGSEVEGLMHALAAAAARGVDVRVCLDRGAGFNGAIDDKHAAPEKWFKQHGVRVVLDELDRRTHAKVLIADGQRILAGSHNWTRSAFMSNREVSWLIDSVADAQAIEAWLAQVPGW